MANTITLYFGSGSPYAWTVWLALEHKALPYEAKRMQFDNGDLKTPEFLAINPRGQVPTLVDGDFAMYESSAMIEYLEDKYPNSGWPLWPADIHERAIARRRAAEVLSHIDPLNGEIFGMVFGKSEVGKSGSDPDAIAKWKTAMTAQLAVVETWLGHDFLAGSAQSAVDFTLYPYLAFMGRIDSRKPEMKLLSIVPPKLAAWMKRIEALPYFDKTYPPHWRG